METMKKKAIDKTELEKRLEAELADVAAQAEAAAEDSELRSDQSSAEEIPALEILPEEDVAALIEERDALKDQLLRARADFDNYRKRVAREDERVRRLAAESMIRDLLPAVDNLERALAHAAADSGGLAQGVEMVLKQLMEVLARYGLERIPSVGEPFNPNVHEAVMGVESVDVQPHHVAQELEKGYRLGDYVLRPAKVAVNVAPQTTAEMQTEE
jgi:molecular chaperone GrpE